MFGPPFIDDKNIGKIPIAPHMNLLHGIVSRAPVLCIYKPHPSPLYTGQFLNRNILRRHAIFRDTTHHSLSQSLDTRRSEVNPRDTVGPFTLGVPPTVSNGKKVPKWSELNTTGKGEQCPITILQAEIIERHSVIRTTARTTNLGVILLGAGLSTLLIYSLTSELFSKNSPTVLYGDACEKIKTSLKVPNLAFSSITPLKLLHNLNRLRDISMHHSLFTTTLRLPFGQDIGIGMLHPKFLSIHTGTST